MTQYLTTKELMDLFRVKSYTKFNEMCDERRVKPFTRGGDGNVYRLSDFEKRLDKKEEAFANV